MTQKPEQIPVALNACASYANPELDRIVGDILDKSAITVGQGLRALVKPNLLMAKPLGCSNPHVVAAACKWLLDKGAKVNVADSPAFGRASKVARAIGLDKTLNKLHIKVENLGDPVSISLPPDQDGVTVVFPIAKKSLECDLILSIPRIKAHSQMRMTLSVKNCFGCVPGMRKAILHTLHGKTHSYFASCLASLWQILPPVAALADGIVAMHVTGPSKGEPYRLGLLGASVSAPALDLAILEILKLDIGQIPLACELARRGIPDGEMIYPIKRPGDFKAPGFRVPQNLKSASFSPAQLVKSLVKRTWKSIKG